MSSIYAIAVRPGSLLDACRIDGAYTDAFAADTARTVPLATWVAAFYTTPLFRAERRLLAWFASAPSTDAEARDLAAGRRDTFAAWTVQARTDTEILLAARRTRSWLGVEPGTAGTRLLFGSAVMPRHGTGGNPSLGRGYSALLGLHKAYSRALIASACARLHAAPGGGMIAVRPKNYRAIALRAIEAAERPVVLMDKRAVCDYSEKGPITQKGISGCRDFEVRDGAEPILGFHDHPREMWISQAYAAVAHDCSEAGWLKVEFGSP